MRILAIVVSMACLAAPAFAEPPACPSGQQLATEGFVDAFQAANGALSAKDYGRALSMTALARPEAASPQQKTAVTQLEVAALLDMDDRPTATRLMKEIMPDPCLPDAVRANYLKKLAEWGVPPS